MFRDLMNHQRVFNIPINFIRKLPKTITPNEYLIKRFKYDNICTGFSSNKYKTYTPFYNFVKNYEKFNIINDDISEYSLPYFAKHYYTTTKKTGIMFNTSKYGYNKLIPGIIYANNESIPLLLISFYNSHEKLKISEMDVFKDNYNITKPEELPNILEYMLKLSNLSRKGVTHIQIDNNVLNQEFSPKFN